MKKVLTILAVIMFAARAGYCAGPALASLEGTPGPKGTIFTVPPCSPVKAMGDRSEFHVSLTGRTYKGGTLSHPFGAPGGAGGFKHSLRFNDDGTVTDNADAFFGNPPVTGKYKLEGNAVIFDISGPGSKKYMLSEDGSTLANGAGEVLAVSLAEKSVGDFDNNYYQFCLHSIGQPPAYCCPQANGILVNGACVDSSTQQHCTHHCHDGHCHDHCN